MQVERMSSFLTVLVSRAGRGALPFFAVLVSALVLSSHRSAQIVIPLPLCPGCDADAVPVSPPPGPVPSGHWEIPAVVPYVGGFSGNVGNSLVILTIHEEGGMCLIGHADPCFPIDVCKFPHDLSVLWVVNSEILAAYHAGQQNPGDYSDAPFDVEVSGSSVGFFGDSDVDTGDVTLGSGLPSALSSGGGTHWSDPFEVETLSCGGWNWMGLHITIKMKFTFLNSPLSAVEFEADNWFDAWLLCEHCVESY